MRVGIVGCGHVSLKHIRALRKIREAEIVGTCDPDPVRGREAAQRAGTDRVYSDLDGMLNDAGPEVVHIATPPRSHRLYFMLAPRAASIFQRQTGENTRSMTRTPRK